MHEKSLLSSEIAPPIMAVLTRDEILDEIEKGRIQVDPFIPENVGPGSLDLTIDDEFRVFRKMNSLIRVDEETDYTDLTELRKEPDQFIILPQECVLGITKEHIVLPPDIAGWLQGRSRFARLGLMVHVTAAFMQPGTSNRQVLEIYNASSFPLAIVPGTRLCQFIFERCEGEAEYQGKFKDQDL